MQRNILCLIVALVVVTAVSRSGIAAHDDLNDLALQVATACTGDIGDALKSALRSGQRIKQYEKALVLPPTNSDEHSVLMNEKTSLEGLETEMRDLR